MLIVDFKPIISHKSICLYSQNKISFAGQNLENDCFVKSVENGLSFEERKESLRYKIEETPTLASDLKIKEDAEKILQYSKSLKQLALVNFVFDEEFFHTPERMKKAGGIIGAANNEAQNAFVKKVFSNEYCYKNENLLGRVENILYTIIENKYSYEGKFAFLDKVLESEKLYKNKGFMDNVGQILYNYTNNLACDKNVTMLDGVLRNEELSSNKGFIQTLGQVLAQKEVDDECLSFVEKKILKAVSVSKNRYAEQAFANLVNEEKFVNNENLIGYLPNIVANVHGGNCHKVGDIVNYLYKKEGQNSGVFNNTLIYEYLNWDYSKINFAEPMARVKSKAYEKKIQLQGGNEIVTDATIDAFFDENRKIIVPALEILGEKNFVHAYRLKISGLKELCQDCNYIKETLGDDEYYEKLLLKINPQASNRYKTLQSKIFDLKQVFKDVKESGDVLLLKDLQNQINDLTVLSRQLLTNKLDYAPDTVINKISVIANSIEVYEGFERKQQLCKFIDLLESGDAQNDRLWQKTVCEQVFKKMNLAYNEGLADRLGLERSKYVGKLLSSRVDVLSDIKELCEEFLKTPYKSNLDIFNQFESNKLTKAKFAEYGLDYNKWVEFDKNSFVVVKSASKEGDGDVIVKKVDMNDFSKVLFLGNEAGCCTAVGTGIYQATVIPYLKQKFVSAIEVLDNGNPVGNTMCYFAEVEGKLALILDNIHVKSEYKNSDTIRDGIFEYAQKLCEEVGKSNLPIYVSGHRNRVDMGSMDSGDYCIKLLGYSGNDAVYLDAETACVNVNPNKKVWAELTRVL